MKMILEIIQIAFLLGSLKPLFTSLWKYEFKNFLINPHMPSIWGCTIQYSGCKWQKSNSNYLSSPPTQREKGKKEKLLTYVTKKDRCVVNFGSCRTQELNNNVSSLFLSLSYVSLCMLALISLTIDDLIHLAGQDSHMQLQLTLSL